MRLIDAVRGSRTEQRFSLEDYINLVSQFTFNGVLHQTPVTQTLQGNREQIGHNFEALVQAAYKSNGIVFACMLARRAVFTEGRFLFRQMRNGRLDNWFSNSDLDILQRPVPSGVTADMLARMIDDADLAGNWYGYRDTSEVVRLRPDWVDILLEPRMLRGGQLGWRKLGYAYFEEGDRGKKPVPLALDEVAHFAPNPDPVASFKGMSWLTPVLREIASDKAATAHKQKFFDNGATPNMVVKVPETMSFEDFKDFMEMFDAGHKGVENAYKTLYLGGGADVEVVGKDFQQIDFKSVQGAGETRIASAAGVPPVIVGFSEGLQGSSLNTGNYMAARRNFADRTIRPLWRSAASSLQAIVPPPPAAELAVDDRDVAFLREDQTDVAEIQSKKASAIRQLTDAGYTADSVVAAIEADDMALLEHSGLFSVQLQPPGSDQSTTNPVDDGGDDEEVA